MVHSPSKCFQDLLIFRTWDAFSPSGPGIVLSILVRSHARRSLQCYSSKLCKNMLVRGKATCTGSKVWMLYGCYTDIRDEKSCPFGAQSHTRPFSYCQVHVVSGFKLRKKIIPNTIRQLTMCYYLIHINFVVYGKENLQILAIYISAFPIQNLQDKVAFKNALKFIFIIWLRDAATLFHNLS